MQIKPLTLTSVKNAGGFVYRLLGTDTLFPAYNDHALEMRLQLPTRVSADLFYEADEMRDELAKARSLTAGLTEGTEQPGDRLKVLNYFAGKKRLLSLHLQENDPVA